MEEKLITFKTAKLAKEKGFDPLTSETWVRGMDGEITTISDWEIAKGKWDEDWYVDLGFYAATQTLLQKWLREEHNIYINVITEQAGFRNGVIFVLEVHKLSDGLLELEYDRVLDDYESALEIGLRLALKLIKL